MNKYFLLIFSVIFLFGFNSDDSTYKNHSSNIRITITPTPIIADESERIILDKNRVCSPCRSSLPTPESGCDTNMAITVSAGKSENKQLKYEYTVSGGRITGEGAKVIWDITGAQPGTYTIKVNIEDKLSGQKRTETKTIEVAYRDCNYDCYCPTLSVDAPSSPTKAGETMIFTANVSGGSQSTVTYNWKISDGKIIEGQGTPVIRVAANSKLAGKTIKATVEIGGVCEVCPKTESATGSIAKPKRIKK